MKLGVFNRIILLNIMPECVDPTLYGIYHDFLKRLSFTEEEHDKFQITHEKDGEVRWQNDEEVEIEIGDKIVGIICARLETCKENGLLKDEHMSLYDKFIN